MPHDVMPIESSLSDPEFNGDPSPRKSGSSILSAMKKAGRALVGTAKGSSTRGLMLAAMAVAGAALCAPAAAQSCNFPYPWNVYACISDPAPAQTTFGAGGQGSVTAGDPVNVATGNVFYHVTDYSTVGQNPLQFIRYYNSMINGVGMGSAAATLGVDWRHNYDRYLQIGYLSGSPAAVYAERPDGSQIPFTLSGSTWVTNSDEDYTLTLSGSTWTLTGPDDTVEVYNGGGGTGCAQLSTITARDGYQQTMSYATTYYPPLYPIQVGGGGGGISPGPCYPYYLNSVTDSYGRSLSFTYGSDQRIATVSTPDSLVLTFGYASADGTDNALTSVSYNTSPVTSTTYNYGSSYSPWLLTDIVDENGNDVADWTYNSDNQAVTSQQGGSLAANATSFSYGSGSTTVTNAFGVTDTYSFTTLQGAPKVTGISRASTSTTAAATESFGYDSNGYQNSFTDWNGNVTDKVNNSHGLPTTIYEAYGSSVARTATIAYDSTWVHLPATITTPGVTTSFTYDSSGNTHTVTQTDTTSGSTPYSTNGTARTWTMTYTGTGQLQTVTGPRTDLTQETQFGYAGGTLTSMTDPLGHVTSVTSYTGGGRPLTIVDPNSVTTTLAYDARLNLNTSTLSTGAGNLVTTYTHDAGNRLTAITLPDLSLPATSFAFNYDAANRLTKVTNALGEYVSFTLDALGDRTVSNIYDSSSTLSRKHTATFDALGRMLTDVAWTSTSASNTTTFAYDPNGNTTSITDPRSNTTGLSFDALNRLYQVTDRLSHTTSATYDAHDRIASITDPNSNATTYTRDGFGRVIQLASPDSGTSVYHYDLASNMTQKTDGASVVTNRTFDAANRELTRTFPGNTAENVTKQYDQTGAWGFGVGRLTTMYDAGQVVYIGYDERGNDIGETHVLSGTYTFNTYNYYDNASRLIAAINPSGWALGWSRDAAGQVTGVAIQPSPYTSAPTLVAGVYGSAGTTPISHLPFGPEKSIPFANGITRTNTYDLDYRLTNMTDSGSSTVLNLSYAYDANRNVTSITDSVNAANSQTMTYDAMDRLLTAASGSGGYGSYAWTYDANGNRASETLNGGTADNYSYNSGTNRLNTTSLSGFGVSYNGAGGTTAITVSGSPLSSSTWSQSQQLASVTFAGSGSPALTNLYDGFGQRLAKSATVATAYFYGGLGNLMEETNTVGQITDYIPLDPSSVRDAFKQVAMIGVPGIGSASSALYFMHNDRLGTPQAVTDTSQNVQWSMTYTPFGAAAGAITNPNTITQNLRLPGMYSDPETGMYHNGARDYVPQTGLYYKTDPVGLAAGTNTYGYARANPFKYIDPSGLDPNSTACQEGSVMCGSGPGPGPTQYFLNGGGGGGGGGNANCNPSDPSCSLGAALDNDLYDLMSDIPGMGYVADNPDIGWELMLAGATTALAPNYVLTTALGAWTGYQVNSVFGDNMGSESASDFLTDGGRSTNPYWLTFKLTMIPKPAR